MSYTQHVDGVKIRMRSPSFADHFSQATMFWRSMSRVEQDHIVRAFTFELSKVQEGIRQRIVDRLQNIDRDLVNRVAANLGLVPNGRSEPGYPKPVVPSPALSQMNTTKNSAKTRKVAILAADGADGKAICDMRAALEGSGCFVKVIAPHMGKLKVSVGSVVDIDGTIAANPSVLFDALFVPGGKDSVQALQEHGAAVHHGLETYVHCKPIAATGDGVDFLAHVGLIDQGAAAANLPLGVVISPIGAVTDDFAVEFIKNISQHRFFDRERIDFFPA